MFQVFFFKEKFQNWWLICLILEYGLCSLCKFWHDNFCSPTVSMRQEMTTVLPLFYSLRFNSIHSPNYVFHFNVDLFFLFKIYKIFIENFEKSQFFYFRARLVLISYFCTVSENVREISLYYYSVSTYLCSVVRGNSFDVLIFGKTCCCNYLYI